ncbi:hypothetical protein AB0395_00455 [Streptosporangium sp. NPDC051023]|uniref:hypothetical protein n=1 Tax=Streptosporangium sp. NPDC051023 TaxID=3155410 RepID=UPI00344E50DB
MSSNIVMLAILALLVVAGLAISLIAIALATIRSVDGQVPQQPADISKAEQRRRQLEQMELPRPRTDSDSTQAHEKLSH